MEMRLISPELPQDFVDVPDSWWSEGCLSFFFHEYHLVYGFYEGRPKRNFAYIIGRIANPPDRAAEAAGV